jgi:hypothetical protein
MIREPKKVTIGERDYYIRKMEPFFALKVLGDLQRRVLGPAAGLLAAMKGGASDPEADNKALTAGIQALSSAMAGPDLEYISNLLINKDYVSVVTAEEPDGIKCDVNVANRVMSDVWDIIDLCKEIAMVNYSDFGKRARGLFG